MGKTHARTNSSLSLSLNSSSRSRSYNNASLCATAEVIVVPLSPLPQHSRGGSHGSGSSVQKGLPFDGSNSNQTPTPTLVREKSEADEDDRLAQWLLMRRLSNLQRQQTKSELLEREDSGVGSAMTRPRSQSGPSINNNTATGATASVCAGAEDSKAQAGTNLQSRDANERHITETLQVHFVSKTQVQLLRVPVQASMTVSQLLCVVSRQLGLTYCNQQSQPQPQPQPQSHSTSHSLYRSPTSRGCGLTMTTYSGVELNLSAAVAPLLQAQRSSQKQTLSQTDPEQSQEQRQSALYVRFKGTAKDIF